jgi:hypothetical protein
MADVLHSHGPANITTLLTTTLENRRKDLQDAIFNDLATIKLLKEKGQVVLDGGASIVTPLMYGKNTTAQFYNGYDQLDTTPQEGFTTGQYKWKESAVSISVSNREENVQNSGESAVLNLVNQKIDQAEMSLKDLLNSAFYAASPSSKEITSLATLVDATSTIGEVNSTTYSWWQSLVTSGGSFAAQGRADMLTTYNTLITRGAAPDFIVTTPTVHAYYEGSLIPQQRYTSNSVGDASFGSLKFKTIPIIFDTAATAGVMYFLNSKHLQLYVSSGNNLKMTEWVKPANQTAKVAQVIMACELATNNRRRLGKITGITA